MEVFLMSSVSNSIRFISIVILSVLFLFFLSPINLVFMDIIICLFAPIFGPLISITSIIIASLFSSIFFGFQKFHTVVIYILQTLVLILILKTLFKQIWLTNESKFKSKGKFKNYVFILLILLSSFVISLMLKSILFAAYSKFFYSMKMFNVFKYTFTMGSIGIIGILLSSLIIIAIPKVVFKNYFIIKNDKDNSKLETSKENEKELSLDSKDYSNGTENRNDDILLEKDNMGTRLDTKDLAIAYWMHERKNMERKDPFLLYVFDNMDQAKSALLKLSCIHIAEDSNNLICTEPLIFGYYSISDSVEAMICGDDLTIDLWEEAKLNFEKFGGKVKNIQKPSAEKQLKTESNNTDLDQVIFLEEDIQNRDGQTCIYRVYKGPDAITAQNFLKQNSVSKQFYYIVVETPEGNYCRDIAGIYKED